MPKTAAALLALVLDTVRAELVPRAMTAAVFDGVVLDLRPGLEAQLEAKLSKTPWRGWLQKSEFPIWHGQLVEAEGVASRIARLARGGTKVELVDGRTFRASEVTLVGWRPIVEDLEVLTGRFDRVVAGAGRGTSAAPAASRAAVSLGNRLDLEAYPEGDEVWMGKDGFFLGVVSVTPDQTLVDLRLVPDPEFGRLRSKMVALVLADQDDEDERVRLEVDAAEPDEGVRLEVDAAEPPQRRPLESILEFSAFAAVAGRSRVEVSDDDQAVLSRVLGHVDQLRASGASVMDAFHVFAADFIDARAEAMLLRRSGWDAAPLLLSRPMIAIWANSTVIAVRGGEGALDIHPARRGELNHLYPDVRRAEERVASLRGEAPQLDLSTKSGLASYAAYLWGRVRTLTAPYAQPAIGDIPATIDIPSGPSTAANDQGTATDTTTATSKKRRRRSEKLPPPPEPKAADLPDFFKRFRDAFRGTLPYHLEYSRASGRTDDETVTFAIVGEDGNSVGWVDVTGEDIEVEWGAVRPGEAQRIEDQLTLAQRTAIGGRTEVNNDEDEDAPFLPLNAKLELLEARTRHLRELSAYSADADRAHRLLGPLLIGLNAPSEEPDETPSGVANFLEAEEQLHEPAQQIAQFMRQAAEPVEQFLARIEQQVSVAQSTATPDYFADNVLIPYDALRGKNDDELLVADTFATAPRIIELPAGEEEPQGLRLRHTGAELGLEPETIVYSGHIDEGKVRRLHAALGALERWLRQSPPSLDAARRGLRLAAALIASAKCGGADSAMLLAEFRRVRDDYDAALRLALEEPNATTRDAAREKVETAMLRLVADAQACAEGQQSLAFPPPEHVRPAYHPQLLLQLLAEVRDSFPPEIFVSNRTLQVGSVRIDDDEVGLTMLAELQGRDRRPAELRLHFLPRDESRVDISGELVDGAGAITRSFPWLTIERALLKNIDGAWLEMRLAGAR